MSKAKTKGGGQKLSDKDMEAHREYMKKYKMHHTEIRKAYRKLALQCHPDRKPSAEALARWEGVPAAYAVLSDPNDRTEYDATLPTRDALVEFYRAYNPPSWTTTPSRPSSTAGTTKSAQRAAAVAVSREKAHKIAMDSQTYKSKDAANAEITWTGTIGSAFCCKGVFSRMFSTTYYEVDTSSPGFLGSHGASDTPGQAMSMNLESPATPSQLSKPVSPEFDPPIDAENLSNATTVDGSPPSGDEGLAACMAYRRQPRGQHSRTLQQLAKANRRVCEQPRYSKAEPPSSRNCSSPIRERVNHYNALQCVVWDNGLLSCGGCRLA
ncbi:hypothetical protein PR002_g13532 [Phytophthora rubi]|uniref:J domain-containing protein n=1 Tax=Phytophthora rubi TaxID=129364 RepID=A0A6A3LBZ7_9STRA|nr:hypothetical protein PR002_g13532 [Phytophthora rubi]